MHVLHKLQKDIEQKRGEKKDPLEAKSAKNSMRRPSKARKTYNNNNDNIEPENFFDTDN